jgi:hypothetical protein
VTRRVEEGDLLALHRDLVGAGALRDAARFARRHVGVADAVEQRRLAVIDVTEHGHDGRALHHAVGALAGHRASG